MTNYDVIEKLIGKISPVGETNEDIARYQNLENMIELAAEILSRIKGVAVYQNSHEASVAAIGKKAQDFINQIKNHFHE